MYPMSIIDKILEVEKKATGLVEEAKKQAAEMKQQLEVDVQAELAAARDKARETIQQKTEEAKKKAKERYDAIIGEVEDRNSSFFEQHADSLEKIVSGAVDIIITPEFEKD